MGIRNLNRFIKEYASTGLNIIPLDKLRNKKVAVDISIYIYQFLSEKRLIENVYLMLAVFKQFKILPIFVFDGKSPIEKGALLKKKRADKKNAQEECCLLQDKLENLTNNLGFANDSVTIQHNILLKNIEMMQKKCINVTNDILYTIQTLIVSFGYSYYIAPNEADEICALLCLQKKVWGCISEDTDMFVYGCQNVIRYFNPVNQTAYHYQSEKILTALNISQDTLREICILSGTDYNINNMVNVNINELYCNYMKTQDLNKYYITDDHKAECNKIKNIFTLNQCNKYDNILEEIKITDGNINYNKIKLILKPEGFLF